MLYSISLAAIYLISAFAAYFGFVNWSATSAAPVIMLSLSYLAMVVVYLLSLRAYSNTNDMRTLTPLLGAAVISRLILIFAPVMLTGDLPRYLWEGMLVREEINPYVYAPISSELISFRNSGWDLIQYKELAAIYPPTAERILGFFARSELIWKSFLLVLECLTLLVLIRVLGLRGLARGRILYYALLPLPLLEITGSGHLEGIFVFFLVAAVYIVSLPERKLLNQIVLGLTLGTGVLVKYTFVLPAAVFCLREIRERGVWYATKVLAFALLSAAIISHPFLPAGNAIFASLKTFIAHWRFNDSLLHLLGWLSGVDWSRLETFDHLKAVLLCAWILLAGALVLKVKDPAKAAAYVIALFLLFSAVFHPWYALWFAPLLCLFNSSSLVYLALIVPLSY